MRRFYLVLTAAMLTLAAWAENEVYTEYSYGTLTYYYDDLRATRTGVTESYDPVNDPDALRFVDYYQYVGEVVIDESMQNAHLTSMRSMFYGGMDAANGYKSYSLDHATQIRNLQYLVTDDVTDMSSMFRGCSWLSSLTIPSTFNTSNVTDMSYMFQFCYNLDVLDLSALNTENVTDMSYMFNICSGGSLDLSGFKTENVTDMTEMFANSFFTSLDLSSFNTDNVHYMTSMFFNCTSLETLDISSFNVLNAWHVANMFEGCSALTTIYNDKDWSLAELLISDGMFNGCTSLAGGNGTACDGTNNTDASYAHPDEEGHPGYFTLKEGGETPGGCTGNGFEIYTAWYADTKTLVYYYNDGRCLHDEPTEIYDQENPGASRFTGYYDQIEKIVIDESMQNANLYTTSYMFFGGWDDPEHDLSSLTEIEGMENLVTDNVTSMKGMFNGCYALQYLDLSHLNTSNVRDMGFMFNDCQSLMDLDLSSFNTSQVTDMSSMFSNCYNLAAVNLSTFNTSNVKNMNSMFVQCGSLQSLDLSHFNTSKVTSMSGMFYGCNNLSSLNVSSFNTSKVTSMRQMFLRCPFTDIDLRSFNTGAVKDMKGMFNSCSNLESVDLSSFNISKVTDMSSMFYNCTRLQTIFCSNNWSTSTVLTNSTDMFHGCTSLVGGKGTVCDGTNNIDKSYARPDGGSSNPGYFFVKQNEIYTVFNTTSGFLTYYYDYLRAYRSGITEVYDPVNAPDTVRFKGYHDQISTVEISASMKNAGLTSTRSMFYGGYDLESQTAMSLSNMTEIIGMENLVTTNVTDMSNMFRGCSSLYSVNLYYLNTTNVTDMSNMFSGCSSLTVLELRLLKTAKVTDMSSMFENCTNLRNIMCNDDWRQSPALTNSADMFRGCTSLRGGSGTCYDSENPHDISYAHPDDGFSDPGYFFVKSTMVYTEFDASTGTLTYYYDDRQYQSDNIIVAYDPVNNPLRFKDYHDDILKVKIDASMQDAHLTSASNMFYGGTKSDESRYELSNLVEIEGMENLVTDEVTDMSYMFYGCSSLDSIDVSHLNTSNVTDMRYMFYGCSSITSLDLNHFSTSKVTDMCNMFCSCSGLEEIKVHNFSTANVTDMSYMFFRCTSLTSLDLNSFNLYSLEDARWMFSASSNLRTIWCSADWSVREKLVNSSGMFEGCTSLVGGRGTACDGVNHIDKSYARPDRGGKPGYFTEQVEEVYTEFDAATGTLTYYYDDQRFYRDGITELYDPIYRPTANRFSGYASQVQKARIDPSMQNARLTSTCNMFNGATDGLEISCELSNLAEIEGMENLVTDEVTDMESMFSNCESLDSIDVSSFNTSNVKKMKNMFNDCRVLVSLDLSSFNTEKVTDMSMMFYYCFALQSLDLSSFNTSNVTNMSYMFRDCRSLESLDLSSFNTENVTNMSYMFESCLNLTSLNLSSFNTSSVENMKHMFSNCSELPSLDLRLFNTSNVTDMSWMFQECTRLRTIWCNDDWNASTVLTNSEFMFSGCYSLVGGNGTTYDGAHLDAAYAHPDEDGNPGYFTVKNEVYTAFDAATGTLTYYYDNQRFVRAAAGEITELYDPVNNPDAIRFVSYNLDVLKGKIDVSMRNAHLTSTRSMFFGGYDLENHMVMSLSYMTEIEGIENLVTDEVTDMTGMFEFCESLTSIDLSSFNTENVTNMNGMFDSCKRLQFLDLNSFNIDNVTQMNYIFQWCNHLETIYCKNDWSQNTAANTTMFIHCDALVGGIGTTYDENNTDVDYAHPDEVGNPGYFTAKKTQVYTAFDAATGTLTYYYDDQRFVRAAAGEIIELYYPVNNPDAVRFVSYNGDVLKGKIDASMRKAHLTSTKSMFYGGYDLESHMVMSLSYMTEIEGIENLVTDEVTDMTGMFEFCESLTSIDLSSFNTENVTNMNGMFDSCKRLQFLDLNSFNIDNVTQMNYMFQWCNHLETIYCNNDWSQNTAANTTMFIHCDALVGGNGTTYDENNTDVDYAHPDEVGNPGYFTAKAVITGPEVYTAFDATTGTLTYYYDDQRFTREASGEITELYDPVNNPDAVRFESYHGDVLKGKIDASMRNAHLTSTRRMFCSKKGTNPVALNFMTAIEGLENLVTDEVTDMSYMFSNCSSLKSLNLRLFNTSNVTDMSSMFFACSSLRTIWCDDDWSASTVFASSTSMFYYCTSLVGGIGTPYDVSHTQIDYAHPDEVGNPGYFTAKKTQVYTAFNATTGTLTYYYDDQRFYHEANGEITEFYNPVNYPNAERFVSYNGDVLKGKIDASMRNAHLTSTRRMFSSKKGTNPVALNFMTAIEGMKNLVTDEVTDMSYMFSNCSSLESLDLSLFNTSNVTDMSSMFFACSFLRTIWCDDDWSASMVLASSTSMFYYCTSLVGGNGTTYDKNNTDVAYAHPDEVGNPGYFTRKNLTLSDQMTAIAISDFIDANNGQTMPEITIQRDVYGNYYNTLCLPFDMNAAQIAASSLAGAEIKAFTGATVDNDVLHLSLTKVKSIQAGKPYFIKYSNPNTLSLLNFINVTVIAGEPAGVTYNGVTLQGTYTGFDMPAQTEESHSYLFLGQNNVLFWPSVSGRIKPFRAYFIVQTGSIHGAPHRGMPAVFDEVETATGMDEVQGDNGQCTKVIENGVLYLKYNGRKYDAQGHFVK